MKVRPFLLSIDKNIWEEFSNNIPDTRTKNGTIVELIEKYNEGCKK